MSNPMLPSTRLLLFFALNQEARPTRADLLAVLDVSADSLDILLQTLRRKALVSSAGRIGHCMTYKPGPLLLKECGIAV